MITLTICATYDTYMTICAIVDFRSALWLPYDHRSVANKDTRAPSNNIEAQ